jgi:hypothetical protein
MTEKEFQRFSGLLAVASITQTAAILMANEKLEPREAVEKAYALRREAGQLISEQYAKRDIDLRFGTETV